METPNIPDSVEALFARDDQHKAEQAAQVPVAKARPAHVAQTYKRLRKRSKTLAQTLLTTGADTYQRWLTEDATTDARDLINESKDTASAIYGLALLEAHTSALANVLAHNVAGMKSRTDETTGIEHPVTDEERAQFAAKIMMPVVRTLANAVNHALHDDLEEDEGDDA
jgi:hypothetical protein